MPSFEAPSRRRRWAPAQMQRIALVAVEDTLRDALVQVADAGVVQFDEPALNQSAEPGEAAQALQRLGFHSAPADAGTAMKLSAGPPDLRSWERDGRTDLLAGEAQLQLYAAGAVHRRDVAALAGWCAADQLPDLTARLDGTGATVVPMPLPRSADPPTLPAAVAACAAASRNWCRPTARCRTTTSTRRCGPASSMWSCSG